MTADGVLVGEIAHIEGALPDSARFREEMSNEDRRAFSNLLLLCGTHHTVVDTDLGKWTTDKLKELKAAHEAIYTGAVDRLLSTVGDLTEGTSWTPATNLRALGDELGADELPWSLDVLHNFAARLATLPLGARSVLALIVSRGEGHQHSSCEVDLPLAVLEGIAACSKEELHDHLVILENAGLAGISWDEHPPSVEAFGSTGAVGWPIFFDLKQLADGDPTVIRTVLVDLDFSVFDR
jgi:hypothetical protein